MNRIDRLFGILLLLQAKRRIRAEDIASKYEISERTVYRDMSALMQLGVPIISQAGEGYSLVEGYYLPPLIFTTDEAKALFLGVKMLHQSGNLQYAADSAMTKLKTALPERLLRDIDPLIEKIDFMIEPNAYDLETPYLVEIQTAIEQQKVLRIRYTGYKQTDITERYIEPIKLTHGNQTWYIRAHCRLRNAMRSFRLERIEHLQILDEIFDASHHVKESDEPVSEQTIQVQIAFPKNSLRWVRERQHYGFTHEDRTPEGAIMHYDVHALSEIRAWVLGWGAQGEVLSPQALRVEIREEAKKLADLLT
ncbi:MAG: YafY family protein [Chloroflexota bacterium]